MSEPVHDYQIRVRPSAAPKKRGRVWHDSELDRVRRAGNASLIERQKRIDARVKILPPRRKKV